MVHLAASPLGTPFSFFHPRWWSEEEHHGCCGMSCPCCRWQVWAETGYDPFGACYLCEEAAELQRVSAAIAAYSRQSFSPHAVVCRLCLCRAFKPREIIRRIMSFLFVPRLRTLTIMQRVWADRKELLDM